MLACLATVAYCRPDWGVYEDIRGIPKYNETLRKSISKIGHKPKYVLFFRDLKRPFPKSIVSSNPEILFVVSLELHEWENRRENYLDRILRGEYDEFFTQWARDAASAKLPFLLRFGFEMSGNWFSWGGKPEQFKQAWKRVHSIFKRNGATNALWLFSPNVLFGSQTPEKNLTPYYPGDSVVDWVGLDGYNFGDDHDRFHRWKSYSEVFESSIQAMMAFGKPLMLSEIGCAHGPRKAEWMRDFLDKVSEDRRVSAFVYFNYDKRSEGEPNWALDSDSATFSIFKSWLERKSTGSAGE